MYTQRDTGSAGQANPIIIEQRITKVNGEVAYRRYRRGEFLGKGGFAKCYEATNLETNKVYAVKVIERASLNKNRAKQKLLSEIKIHKSLHHPHIVQFENCFEDAQNVYIFLELCTNKSLSEMLKRRKKLTYRQTKYFMHQIISATQYMHGHRIIHRDLKMGNIFINANMELKVGDFGLATKLEFAEERKRTICGTPNYIAPEIIQGIVGHSYEVDVWSCGVICYALLYGKPPFETSEVKATYARIKVCKYDFPDVSVPEDAKDFIRKILVLDPKMRPTLDQLLDHPFMQKKDDIKYLPIEAQLNILQRLTEIPNLKNQSNEDIKKKEGPQKLRATDFAEKKKEQDDFLGMCTSPRNGMGGLDKQPSGVTNSQRIQIDRLGSANSTQRPDAIDDKSPSVLAQQDVSVVKHVDYSSKYGLGYILSNGCYGVYFNDASKINFNPTTEEISFIPKPEEAKQDSSILKYTPATLPKLKDLQKKYSLLEHFKYYLDAEMKDKKFVKLTSTKLVYMKQWLKTKHAIMFRLSNKVFQVDFLDQSQILLNTDSKMVTYTNKKGQRSVHTLNEALNSSESEMSRRINYTKGILNSIRKNSEEPQVEGV